MLPRLVICTAILSVVASAWGQVEKDSTRDNSSELRTCGVPGPAASLKTVDHFGNYWLNEDVRWLIDDEERLAYKKLSNDEERDNFIDVFWLRRDPTRDTIKNEFKDEHYRRIVYANEQFSGRVPGWKTDRGRFYIRYGPPDSIEFTTLGALKRKQDEDNKKNSSLLGRPKQNETKDLEKYSMMPAEAWHYRYLEGIGSEVTFGFADECGCGDPHLKTSSSAWPFSQLHDLSSQPSEKESGATKSQVGSIEMIARPLQPPQPRFKDLEEVVTSVFYKTRYNQLPFQALTSAVRATEYTDMVALTLQFHKRDLAWKENSGTSSVELHVFARLHGLTGRVAATLEEDIKNFDDPPTTSRSEDDVLQFSRLVPLHPGRYRLDVAVEDVNANKMGTWSRGVIVPDFYADEFKTSPLILVDQIDASVHRADPTAGGLYIGDVRIHPRLPASSNESATFHQGEQLGLFFQAYNLAPKPQTAESEAIIAYKMVNTVTGKAALDVRDTSNYIGKTGEQLTARQLFSTADIPKGDYVMCVRVDDRITNKRSTSSARVRIE